MLSTVRPYVIALTVLAAGCVDASTDSAVGDGLERDPTPLASVLPSSSAEAPPGVAPTLVVSSIVPGQTTTWTISDLDPNEQVYLGRSPRLGSGLCPAAAGGVCLDIANPVSLQGVTRADGSGVARLTFDVPWWAPLGAEFAFQAIALRGTNSVKSAPVVVSIDDLPDTGAPVGLTSRPSNTTCFAPDRPASDADLTLNRVFSNVNMSLPTIILQRPGDDSYWYVGEKAGRIRRFVNSPSVSSRTVVLDIAGRVNDSGNELGFLAMTFHPDFPSEPYLYAGYNAGGFFNATSRISRFTSTDGGVTFDPNSEQILIEITQPATNHNGGHMAFGPDGYLYWGFGDGGSGNDPWNNAQNLNTLLGKMIRIDVDGGGPGGYSIPPTNPFANGGGSPEIFAWGLRNPWRWSFDRLGGDLWVGDVGQDAREEISKVELGGNYGWRVMEGTYCANPGGLGCNAPEFTEPVWEYAHTPGSKSVIGGFVYRGSEMPALVGTYLFAEFYTGEVFGLFNDPVTGDTEARVVAQRSNTQISTFTEDVDGEIYIGDYAGRMYKIEEAVPQPVTPFPQLLSETGCFDPADPSVPVDAMIPYEPRSRLWSDGLTKRRWFALPDGTTIDVGRGGDWTLPIGGVTVKEFTYNGRRVETRFFVRHDDGDYGAYTYRWNIAGTDAVLVNGGQTLDLGPINWRVPSQAECMNCHTEAAGRSLALETAQLNSDFDYGGVVANQLRTLDDIGVLNIDLPQPGLLPAYPFLQGPGSEQARVRSYLHSNCAMCHQPGGTGLGDMDLRYTTPFGQTGMCNVPPANGNLGINNARIVAPGNAARSVLHERLATLDSEERMPPLGTSVVHTEATDLVADWINGLSGCP